MITNIVLLVVMAVIAGAAITAAWKGEKRLRSGRAS